LYRAKTDAGLYLLFTAGSRPHFGDVERLLSDLAKAPRPRALASLRAVGVSRPETGAGAGKGAEQTGLELLANGLTFDVLGLVPMPPRLVPRSRYHFGLSPGFSELEFEAVELSPGPHLADAGLMLPVLKTMAAVAGELATGLGAQAISWSPAGCLMDPGYFDRMIYNWNNGGPFPALGLTGIATKEGGVIESDGLAYFTGQEIQIEPRTGEPPVDTVKVAVRVIDYLAHYGKLGQPDNLTGPDGAPMRLEPSADGSSVRVIRGL
jgi:hypothetical protein